MTIERVIVQPEAASVEEKKIEVTLRPHKLGEYIGQKPLVQKLEIAITAALRRGEPLDHVLFHGPPGLGKTTLAHILAYEMNANIVVSSGPVLERPADLMGILTNLKAGDVFFIDEIHRLPKVVEEFLYSAMEDFKIDFVVDKGAFAKTIPITLQRFTLVGATTRAGLLTAPLRERFGIFQHIDLYPVGDLVEIVRRSACILGVEIDGDGAHEIAARSRGTPRIANRLLKRVRDYVQVRHDGRILRALADQGLAIEGVDTLGLDDLDRKYLRALIVNYHGGPAGIESLCATINEERDTLEDMVEPFLLHAGLLARTRSGRMAARTAYAHLGIPWTGGEAGPSDLFEQA